MPTCLNTQLIFEHPCNETLRICLRLEPLFQQLEHDFTQAGKEPMLPTLETLLQIFKVVDRPDLKSKFCKSLMQHISQLTLIKQRPEVDDNQLTLLLKELNGYVALLDRHRHRIGDTLRQNEFIKAVRLQLGNPGGIQAYQLPSLHCWRNRPNSECIKDIAHWSKPFLELKGIVRILLKMAREFNAPQSLIAHNGFYQQNLGRQFTPELLRISLESDSGMYPEISVGHHRISIRFLLPDFGDSGRAKQVKKDIRFQLQGCS